MPGKIWGDDVFHDLKQDAGQWNSGADPEFLDRGIKFAEGGSIWSIYPTFLKILHENEIIWTQDIRRWFNRSKLLIFYVDPLDRLHAFRCAITLRHLH